MAKRSNASCLSIGHSIFAAWAVGLRKVPKSPFNKLQKPFCSDFSDSVCNVFINNKGVVYQEHHEIIICK
jgi:hypothetical protein